MVEYLQLKDWLEQDAEAERRYLLLAKLAKCPIRGGCAGFHITSLDRGINTLITRGFLPGKPISTQSMTDGRVIFLMLPSFSDPIRIDWYGKITGARHYLMKQLGIAIADSNFTNYVVTLLNCPTPCEHPYFPDFAQTYGANRPDLAVLIEKATQRRGVLLGFSSKLMHPPSEVTYGTAFCEEDWTVTRPGGFPIDFISGILPLGPVEKAFFHLPQKSG